MNYKNINRGKTKKAAAIISSLYKKSWENSLSSYSKHFPNRESEDRNALIEMTNHSFGWIAAILDKRIKRYLND